MKTNINSEKRNSVIELANPFAELDKLICDDGRDALEIAAELRSTRVNNRVIEPWNK